MGINEVKQYANKLVHPIQEAEGKNGLNQTVLYPVIIKTADEVTGKEERMIINGLFDEECAAGTKNKNETYSKMIQWRQTRPAQEQYKKMRKIKKRIHIKKGIIQRTNGTNRKTTPKGEEDCRVQLKRDGT